MTDVPSPADAPTVLEAQAAAPDDRPALVAGGVVHTHADVRRAATAVARDLLGERDHLDEDRVLLLAEPTPDYVAALLGTWLAGGLAVPVRPGVPRPEIDRVVEDAAPAIAPHDGANADALGAVRADLPAAIGLHSGPSKSADIGQVMVKGVHGPGRVIAVVAQSGLGAYRHAPERPSDRE